MAGIVRPSELSFSTVCDFYEVSESSVVAVSVRTPAVPENSVYPVIRFADRLATMQDRTPRKWRC